nr:hypothetical protein [Candidatus Sigynarchaeum springense]
MEATKDGHGDDPAAIDGGGRRKRHYFELLARGIDDEMPAPIKIGIPCCRCFEKYSPGASRHGS